MYDDKNYILFIYFCDFYNISDGIRSAPDIKTHS